MAEYRILCCFPGCTNIAEVIVGDEMPAGSIGRRHIFCPAHETKACEICGGTGTYVMPSAFEDEHGNVIETESRLLCHGCNGTGKAAYSQSSLFDNVDQNDIVFHPQTGEKLLIPQVCCECGSGNLGHYTVQGDFLPTDGWRICGDCEAINSPMCEPLVCPDCLGYGGHLTYVAGAGDTPDCTACGGTGRMKDVPPAPEDDELCLVCGGTGIYVMPVAYDNGDGVVHEDVARQLCHGCNGSGRRRTP